MIVVTRLNATQFAVNPDLIERIHESPDTTLVMVDGAKYIVTESLGEVIDLIAAYRARIISLARFVQTPAVDPTEPGTPRPLGLVRDADPTSGGGAAQVHVPDPPVPLRPRTT
ncbi:flagellar FlbD family protein [Arthrobacter agilis]|uniref:flagellar FlbD family protein n=1 Tax=Arthrobacter agilis TaxID=37921 RepID=UPI0023658A88|nr:flagellar FlbD family protein [Arthrobacter agilis]WDF33770.1 flagellar FlbD family protein [Arthrobacter agilis]